MRSASARIRDVLDRERRDTSGVPIEYWLFSQIKTTGSFHSAASARPSWNPPIVDAPSPKKHKRDAAVAAILRRERRARRDRHVAADDAVAAEEVVLLVEQVHRAAEALQQPVVLP